LKIAVNNANRTSSYEISLRNFSRSKKNTGTYVSVYKRKKKKETIHEPTNFLTGIKHGKLKNTISRVFGLFYGLFMPPLRCMYDTEAEGGRELVQNGVLPSLAGEEFRGGCDMYWDGRSEPPALTDRTACPVRGCSAANFRRYQLLMLLIYYWTEHIQPIVITEITHCGPGHFLVDTCVLPVYETPYSNLGYLFSSLKQILFVLLTLTLKSSYVSNTVLTNICPKTVSEVEKHWNKKIKGSGQTATTFSYWKGVLAASVVLSISDVSPVAVASLLLLASRLLLLCLLLPTSFPALLSMMLQESIYAARVKSMMSQWQESIESMMLLESRRIIQFVYACNVLSCSGWGKNKSYLILSVQLMRLLLVRLFISAEAVGV